jgi:PhnB protein
MTASSLTPMLTVKNAVAAIAFYRAAFDAVEQARFTSPTGHVVVEMAIDGLRFFVVDENPEAFNLSPKSLDGTTVRINLIVSDPDSTAAQAIRAGASEIFPVADQPYGLRQGRVPDATTPVLVVQVGSSRHAYMSGDAKVRSKLEPSDRVEIGASRLRLHRERASQGVFPQCSPEARGSFPGSWSQVGPQTAGR